jgi:hypothetical protein
MSASGELRLTADEIWEIASRLEDIVAKSFHNAIVDVVNQREVVDWGEEGVSDDDIDEINENSGSIR